MKIEARINEIQAQLPKITAEYSVAWADAQKCKCEENLKKALALNATLQQLLDEEIELQQMLITQKDLVCEVMKAQAN